MLVTNNRCKHFGITYADDDCTTLAGNFPGLERDRLVTVLKGFLNCTHGCISSSEKGGSSSRQEVID
jgi:hypothetical protein